MADSEVAVTSIYSFSAYSAKGEKLDFEYYQGHVLLVVNTASRCGFTPQYAGLQRLHHDYSARGLDIFAFPCNQFAAQEPGDDAAIERFCTTQFNIGFELMRKIDVNGVQAHPLYQHLKAAAPGLLGSHAIKWNFTKFLVDRSGQHIERFGPQVTPDSLSSKIEALL